MKAIYKMPLLIILGFVFNSSFAGELTGTITFIGTIVNETCEIDKDYRNQVVDFGKIPISELKNKGDRVPAKGFSIILKNCNFKTTQSGQNAGKEVTKGNIKFIFDNIPGDDELISLTSNENREKVAIRLLDSTGKPIKNNKILSLPNIVNDTYKISYQAHLQALNTATEGPVHATARWVFNYK